MRGVGKGISLESGPELRAMGRFGESRSLASNRTTATAPEYGVPVSGSPARTTHHTTADP
jgi:hypothetical protein